MITLTREEAQQVLDALEKISMGGHPDWANDVTPILRARLAQPEPEPVAWMMLENKLVPIHTAPPQREWQGLTDEEAGEIWAGIVSNAPSGERLRDFARAIEAKLKEKNT
jgi:hypothetical protein